MSKSLYQTSVENRAPTSSDTAVIGNWWIDTSASPNALYLYKASGWELQGGGGVQESAEMTMTDAMTFIANHNILYGKFTFLNIVQLTNRIANIDDTGTLAVDTNTSALNPNDYILGIYSNHNIGNNLVHKFKSNDYEISGISSLGIRYNRTALAGTTIRITESSSVTLSDSTCKVKFYYI